MWYTKNLGRAEYLGLHVKSFLPDLYFHLQMPGQEKTYLPSKIAQGFDLVSGTTECLDISNVCGNKSVYNCIHHGMSYFIGNNLPPFWPQYCFLIISAMMWGDSRYAICL